MLDEARAIRQAALTEQDKMMVQTKSYLARISFLENELKEQYQTLN